MKKMTTTITALAAYTQERTKVSKTVGGSIRKQVQAKTKSKPQKCVMMVKRSCTPEADACELAMMAQMHAYTQNTSCL
jgi:hypothetical protein